MTSRRGLECTPCLPGCGLALSLAGIDGGRCHRHPIESLGTIHSNLCLAAEMKNLVISLQLITLVA